MSKEKIMFQEDGDIREDKSMSNSLEVENIEFANYEKSYHCCDSDIENEDNDETDYGYEREFYLFDKDNPKIEVGAKFPHVVAFRRALNHYDVINVLSITWGRVNQHV
jgi:hypothetical protein